jgi:DNA-binding NarL/FixJ family response regulator
MGAIAAGRMIRLLIADDQALVRSGFAMILNAQPDFEVVGEAADGQQALDLARRLRPDLILMDVRMPRLDGIAATRELFATSVATAPKVVILTTFDLDAHVYEALRAGASGFLLKDVSPDELVRAVHTVLGGEALLAPTVMRRLIDDFLARPQPTSEPPTRLRELTDRESEILIALARGLSNAEIAEELNLSAATIKTHVARVLTKLDVRDRVHAAITAYETGIVRPGDAGRTV